MIEYRVIDLQTETIDREPKSVKTARSAPRNRFWAFNWCAADPHETCAPACTASILVNPYPWCGSMLRQPNVRQINWRMGDRYPNLSVGDDASRYNS